MLYVGNSQSVNESISQYMSLYVESSRSKSETAV
jgi:hypothetical protein